MAVYEVDPISRIEGHLGVKLTTNASGFVSDAEVHGNLWRGFENFLIGRKPNDAITFTQRICGVCPVPHGQASTFAIDAVYGYNNNFQTWVSTDDDPTAKWGGDTGMETPALTPAGKGIPAKAVHIRNLVLSAEFLMSHITHSYHLAAPSYVQGPPIPPWTPYYHDSFYSPLLRSAGKTLPTQAGGYSTDLWSATITQYVKALRIRRLTFEAGALFAGRMPMTSCFVAGGVTNDNAADLNTKCSKYRDMMVEVGNFIVKEFVPLFLALGALYSDFDNQYNSGFNPYWADGNTAAQDKTAMLAAGVSAGKNYGGGCGNFLAWGAFPQLNGTLGMARGYKLNGSGTVYTIGSGAVISNLSEHIKHSRYQGSVTTLNATGGPNIVATNITSPATEMRTIPERSVASKYSWLKAPRWKHGGVDYPMEVGPFARMVVGGFYPVDGSDLAVNVKLGPIYQRYLWDPAGNLSGDPVSGELGLDPAMVGADLAVALVREGLATLVTSLDGGATKTTVTAANVGTLTPAQILAGYSFSGGAGQIQHAYIMGIARDWIVNLSGGLSIMDRLRGRALESLVLIIKMIGDFSKGANGAAALTWPAYNAAASTGWIQALRATSGGTYISKTPPTAVTFGFGATEAPRGALMHMATIENDRIKAYQCIVPTTWNASPKDAGDARGPMEEAMMYVPYSTQKTAFKTVANVAAGAAASGEAGGGVEALRVAQSFDPCIACAVH